MGIFQSIKSFFTTRSTPPPSLTGNGGGGFFGYAFPTTKKGIPVSEKSALTLSSFFNGIEIITNDFAKLPKSVYKKAEGNRKKIATHHVQKLISFAPNEFQTAFMFDKMLVLHAILKGNGYAYIHRTNGKPTALELIDQENIAVEILKHKGKLFYKINGKIHSSYEIVHIPGFSFDGIVGISVIQAAAQSLGVSLSSQEFSSDYYNTKGVGTAIVTTPKQMNPEAKMRYSNVLASTLDRKEDWKVAVVDEGGEFTHLKISPQEAQFLTTNKYGIEEVARWLNIPPHKLKSLDNVNNSITENQEIQHVADSIVPWVRKFEQEYTRKLFTDTEINNGFYIKANEYALLRADKKTQAEFISKMVNNGIMTRNEARAVLDYNALEGLDAPLQPVNTMTEKQFNDRLKEKNNGKNNNT